MIPLKDGTAWSALEYLRYLNGTEENGGPQEGEPAVIVPVGIAYCDKRKYRSRVVVQYVILCACDSLLTIVMASLSPWMHTRRSL